MHQVMSARMKSAHKLYKHKHTTHRIDVKLNARETDQQKLRPQRHNQNSHFMPNNDRHENICTMFG